MTEELFPCPLCRGAAILECEDLDRTHEPHFSHNVFCKECGCEVSGGTEAIAISRWNTRAKPVEALPADKAAALEALESGRIELIGREEGNILETIRTALHQPDDSELVKFFDRLEKILITARKSGGKLSQEDMHDIETALAKHNGVMP